jgi:hypothetical protein
VIICEIIVHLLVIVQNNKICTVQRSKIKQKIQKSVGTAGSPDELLNQGPPDAPHTRSLLLATTANTNSGPTN